MSWQLDDEVKLFVSEHLKTSFDPTNVKLMSVVLESGKLERSSLNIAIAL